MSNQHLVMIAGKTGTGKSAALRNLDSGVMYLNAENGKRLPFTAPFLHQLTVTDPLQVFEAIDAAEAMPEIHTIAIDTATYLMDLYESVHVINATNTMQAWGEYAQFWKTLLQQYVARSTKNVIFLAHTMDILNEGDMIMETKVPVKGSLKNQGLESYFSCVIGTVSKSIKELEGYENDLLTFSDEERIEGVKYCFQTKKTEATRNGRIRGPMGMWSTAETFIDNDVQLVLDRLHTYYGTGVAAA